MTGRGKGYCALVLPQSGETPYGYAGLQGTPVRLMSPPPAIGGRFARWLRPVMRLRRAFGRGRGRGAGGGRGRRLYARRW